MNCTVYTVMEGHGNTTDKSIIKISSKGFSSQDYSKTKTMYVILFAGETFRGLPKHLLHYTLLQGPEII